MTVLSLPLSQGLSTFHGINVFRCDVAEFSDNLAGYKRVICLNVKMLQRNAPARSYEKTYNLAGNLMIYIRLNALITNMSRLDSAPKSSARLSDI